MLYSLSFSGAGHLLPYHLGVAVTLLPQRHRLLAVAGSSSGAIAATVFSLLTHRLEEYSERFLHDRGHAYRNLQQMLMEEQLEKQQLNDFHLQLSICTTKCSDGKMHLHSFDTKRVLSDPSPTNEVLKAVQASCAIPRSFHPFDIFFLQPLSFPDEEGVEIDGAYYVDGGIAAPVPPTSLDEDPKCLGRIEVSPISGPKVQSLVPTLSIRPCDNSLPLLPFSLTTTRCQPFSIRPSLQNVRALVVSAGLAKPQVLRDWYQRGFDDASKFVEEYLEKK